MMPSTAGAGTRRPRRITGRSRGERDMLHLTLRGRRAACIACLTASMSLGGVPALAGDPALLVLEQKIPLGKVSGRIDHLAIDAQRHRLFMAELGNNSVGIVDLDT